MPTWPDTLQGFALLAQKQIVVALAYFATGAHDGKRKKLVAQSSERALVHSTPNQMDHTGPN